MLIPILGCRRWGLRSPASQGPEIVPTPVGFRLSVVTLEGGGIGRVFKLVQFPREQALGYWEGAECLWGSRQYGV